MELNSNQFNAPAKRNVTPEEAEQNRLNYGIRVHSVAPFEDRTDGGGFQNEDLDPHGGRYLYNHILATVPEEYDSNNPEHVAYGEGRKVVGRISYTSGSDYTDDLEGFGHFRGIEVDPEYAHLGIHHILLKAANTELQKGWGLPGLRPGTGRNTYSYRADNPNSQSIMSTLGPSDAMCDNCYGEGCTKCDDEGYETKRSTPHEKWLGWKLPPKNIGRTDPASYVKINLRDKSKEISKMKELPTNWEGK